MNKNKFKNFIKEARTVRLNPEEKGGIKNILNTHIDLGVRKEELTRFKHQRSRKMLITKPMPILLALILTFSGGTALAANNSLPGDLLYPVKVEFNEKVRGSIAFNSEARANLQTDMAIRRLEEVQKLIVQRDADLDAEMRSKIEARFNAHLEKTQKLIEELEAKGNLNAAAAVSSRLEASLRTHEEIFNSLLENREEASLRLQGVLESVQARVEFASQSRERNQEGINSTSDERAKVTVQNTARQSQRAIDSIKALLERYEQRIEARVQANIEAKIESALSAHARGLHALSEGNYREAIVLFQNSLAFSHQANVMLRTWASIGLNINPGREGWDTDSLGGGDDSQTQEEDSPESENTSVQSETDAQLRINGAGVNSDTGARIRLNIGL